MYKFYLNSIILPITPSKLKLKIDGNNKTINLINSGEVNQIKSNRLTTIQFECLIPRFGTNTIYANELTEKDEKNSFRSARGYLNMFEKLKNMKEPFKFKVIRKFDEKIYFFTNMTVTLETYDILEDSKNGFDIIVSVTLKQYREYGTKVFKVKKNKKATLTDTNKSKKNSTYTIKKGDCLSVIAKKELNDSSKWKTLYNMNKTVIEQAAKKHGRKSSLSGHYIYPGTILKLK